MVEPKTHSAMKHKRIIACNWSGVTPLLIIGHDHIKALQKTFTEIMF